jgi:hypothetical protein
MNNVSRWIRSIVMLTTVAVAVIPALHAQNELGHARINVPFAFDYGSRHFAPGVYDLYLSTPRLLMVRAVDGSMGAIAMLQEEITAQPPDRSKAVFLKSGSSYQLQALWMSGSNEYFHTIRWKAKKQPELASDRAPSSTVEVALLEEPAHTRN